MHLEFPKCLYRLDGSTLTVPNAAKQADALESGWLLLADYQAALAAPHTEPVAALPGDHAPYPVPAFPTNDETPTADTPAEEPKKRTRSTHKVK